MIRKKPNIPLVDLAAQTQQIRGEVLSAIEQVVDKCNFILGDEVDRFEQQFADYCAADYCVGVANGTEALHLALRAVGVRPGDEVITVANSFAATVFAIVYAGATPVLVDVDPTDFTMDLNCLEEAITEKTSAIIPVHLYGQPAKMDEIQEIANRFGLKVVEDAAQAHGAEYRGKRAGSIGDAGCFSFYPGKNLGAFGDGGAICTNNAQMADELRWMRNYGQAVKNVHSGMGFNCRLDTIQAAVLSVKLKYLEQWTEARRAAAGRYRERLASLPLQLPVERDDARHVYHLFVARSENRDELVEQLKQHQIFCGIHYPHPLHTAVPFQHARTIPYGVPVSTQLAAEIFSLPMYPELNESLIEQVAIALESCLAGNSPA